MKSYLFNLLVAVDQFANTVLGGNPDETISLRLKKAKDAGDKVACIFCKVLDLFDKGHCDKVTT